MLAFAQGISWIHDYTFFKNPELVQACVQAGVEYMPMIVRIMPFYASLTTLKRPS